MRGSFVLVPGLAVALVIGACSSSTEEKPGSGANADAPAGASNSSELANTGNSNTVILANGSVVMPQTVDANAASTASADQSPLGAMSKRQEQMRKAGGSAEGVDPAVLAMKNARPAPDNSTFTSYLTDAGYEIRQFENHPQLLKVEKKTENTGDQFVKVFLRNGNIVQLPGKAIPILSTASADSIADAAGLATAPVKAPPPGATGAKKSAN